MNLIIKIFENKIEQTQTSLNAHYQISKYSWCHITDSGIGMLLREEKRLSWYKKELQILKSFNQCNCSRLYKFITSLKKEHKSYGNIKIYKCEKCNGYFSK